MFQIGILVFREVLEAALIISIVCAVTRNMPNRSKWVTGGVLAGILGAFIVALFAGKIADSFDGVGQEIFNASVLLLAVLMIAWHAIWMSKHGKELATQMKQVGLAVREGQKHLSALALVVALAVLREGSEIVLFLHGMLAGGDTWRGLIIGGSTGLALGAILGFALYFGLLKLSIRYFFTATNWLMVLLAAGLAAQAANYLNQADWLPDFGSRWWDTSSFLSQDSILGQILHALVGYQAAPSGIQVIVYFLTAIIIILGMKFWSSPSVLQQSR